MQNFCVNDKEVISPADAQDNTHIVAKGCLYFPCFNGLDSTAECNFNYTDDQLDRLLDGGKFIDQ